MKQSKFYYAPKGEKQKSKSEDREKLRKQKPKQKNDDEKKTKIGDFLFKKPEGRQNRYVFKGFHEQLNSISAKISHTNSKRYGHLREEEATRYLMGFGSYDSDDEGRVQLTSNFLSMMSSALRLNISKHPSLARLLVDLRDYTSSYNLVVLKKDEIVQKLLDGLDIQGVDHLITGNPKIAIIDLLIALIKDLRGELSFETIFTKEIFPKIITCLDVTQVELLEQIILFFSHCFKYMLPVLLKNFDKFYKSYFALINHKNVFIRRYASESFSYILRKIYSDGSKSSDELVKYQSLKFEAITNLPKIIENVRKSKCNSQQLVQVDEDNMQTDIFQVCHKDVDTTASEIFEPAYLQYEKELDRKLHNFKATNSKTGSQYQIEFTQKRSLIITISNLFVETIYGVQKKLYTNWKNLINMMIKYIVDSKNQESQVWYIQLLRYTVIQLVPRLEQNALHDLLSYVINNLGEAHFQDHSVLNS